MLGGWSSVVKLVYLGRDDPLVPYEEDRRHEIRHQKGDGPYEKVVTEE